MVEQMKLSTAIREGAKLRPQAFRAYFYTKNGVICSCAFGAAYEAVTGNLPRRGNKNYIDEVITPVLDANFPVLQTFERFACPADKNCTICSPFNIVTHLNDTHDWTREQIADWLEEKGF